MKRARYYAETVKNFIRNKYPEIIVIVLCIMVLCGFSFQKEGYHMDELLSFELANAEFTPWIVPTQPEGRLEKYVVNEIREDTLTGTISNITDTIKDVLKNRGDSKLLSYKADVYDEPVWISRQEFVDYITVDGQDDFNYLSVYFNVKDDNHPPLHFMLLHTISSIFKKQIMPFMGCAINICAITGILILLMKLGEIYGRMLKIRNLRLFIITVAVFYGLSAGAIVTSLLIRMYALLTLFCIALLYIHVNKWVKDEFCCRNVWLASVTVCGFLTQYFFLFYCLSLAVVTAVLLLRAKKYKGLLVYVRTMTISAVIGVGIYPFAIQDVFSSGRGVEALQNLSAGISGYGIRILEFGKILISRCGGGITAVLFGAAVIGILYNRYKKGCSKDGINKQLIYMLIIPPLVYFLLASRMAPYTVDRYIMPVYPMAVFVLSLIIYVFAGQNKNGSLIATALILIIQVAGIFTYDGSGLYCEYGEQIEIAQSNEELPCICVYAGVGYYENLIEFTKYERTLLVTADELENRQDVESISGLDAVTVIVKYGVDREHIKEVLKEKYKMSEESVLYRSREVTADEIYMFVSGE